MTSTEPLLAALREAGFRLTPQRRAVCATLAEASNHPTAQSIHAELSRDYPSLSLTTVYNTLDALVRVGAIHALGTAGDETTHYEPNTEPHINVACITCHRIEDYDSDALQELDSELRRRFRGRNLLGSRLVYYTDCIAATSPEHCPFSGNCCGKPRSCKFRRGGCEIGKRYGA